MPAKNGKAPPPEITSEVKLIAKKLNAFGHRKPGHLLNFGLAMLKYLAQYGESDNIRLQATKALLDIPTIRQLSGNIRTKLARHLHQHVHLEAGPASDQKLLEERLGAMLSAGGAEARQAIEALAVELEAAKPNETKPNE